MRVKKVEDLRQERGLDCVVIAGQPNLFYYTGFRGYGALVDCDGRQMLVTIVLEMNRAISTGLEVLVADPSGIVKGDDVKVFNGRLSEAIASIVGNKKVGLDKAWVDNALLNALSQKMNAEDVSVQVRDQRAVKDESEIETIKTAGEITRKALRRALEELEPGMTEREFSAVVDYYLKRYGGEGYAFETIVASGRNAAFPHHVPSDERLSPPVLLVDWGAKFRGYCFDSTRTIGTTRREEVRKAYEAVLEAQLTAIDMVSEGVKASELDRKAREVLAKYGLDKYFHHSLGHGVGVEIHEHPTIGPSSNDVLKKGMVITIEPGVYMRDSFGIRIEDTLVVGSRKAEVLETLPKVYTEILLF